MNWHHTDAFDATKGSTNNPGKGVGAERRRSRRRRVLYKARLIFNDTVLSCTVKDVSEFGCKLKFAVPPMLPEKFDLIMNKTGERHKCQLVWLSDREVGVRFADLDD